MFPNWSIFSGAQYALLIFIAINLVPCIDTFIHLVVHYKEDTGNQTRDWNEIMNQTGNQS